MRRRGCADGVAAAAACGAVVDRLEERLMFFAYVVDNTNDSGAGSLRLAILQANVNPGGDRIEFRFTTPGVHTIRPTLLLPGVTEAVTFDGTLTNGYDGSRPLVQLSGAMLPSGIDQVGLDIAAGNSEVFGMIFTGFRTGLTQPGAGLLLRAGGGNVVEGCWFGVDAATGNTASPNGDGVRINASSNNRIGGVDVGFHNLISGNDRYGVNIVSGSGNIVAASTVGLSFTGSTAVGNGSDGIRSAGQSTTIGGGTIPDRNVISANGSAGIHLVAGADSSVIAGNYIGTSTTGNAGRGNRTFGILLDGVASVNVGGLSALDRNVVSANQQEGIALLNSRDAFVQGNYVGTDAAGTADLGNASSGVFMLNSPNNRIGGESAAARNVISGNDGHGVEISGLSSTNNAVVGNLIGTDATGTLPLGNAFTGVNVRGGSGNRVGTAAAGEGNVICANGAGGVLINGGNAYFTGVTGNSIGVGLAGAVMGNHLNGVTIGAAGVPIGNCQIGGAGAGNGNVIANNDGSGVVVLAGSGNAIFGNSIYANGLLGIDLGGDGATANDVNDGDAGPNDLQNFPTISSAYSSPTGTVIKGSLNAAPGLYAIDVYATPGPAIGSSQGRQYLGFIGVNVGASFNADWEFNPIGIIPPGYVVTATASNASAGTSEFSAAVTIADQIPPTLVFGAFHWQTLPHGVSFVFSEDVGSSVDGDEVTFVNLTTGLVQTPNSYMWNPTTNTLSFTFAGILPDGNYRATLHAGNIYDGTGNNLDGNADGTGGDDRTFDFYFLNADTNRDRHVNFADLVTMAQHYNESGHPWALGDHDYNGVVNFADLVILAQRYNTTLAPPMPAPAPSLLRTISALPVRVFSSARPMSVTDLSAAVSRPMVVQKVSPVKRRGWTHVDGALGRA